MCIPFSLLRDTIPNLAHNKTITSIATNIVSNKVSPTGTPIMIASGIVVVDGIVGTGITVMMEEEMEEEMDEERDEIVDDGMCVSVLAH